MPVIRGQMEREFAGAQPQSKHLHDGPQSGTSQTSVMVLQEPSAFSD